MTSAAETSVPLGTGAAPRPLTRAATLCRYAALLALPACCSAPASAAASALVSAALLSCASKLTALRCTWKAKAGLAASAMSESDRVSYQVDGYGRDPNVSRRVRHLVEVHVRAWRAHRCHHCLAVAACPADVQLLDGERGGQVAVCLVRRRRPALCAGGEGLRRRPGRARGERHRRRRAVVDGEVGPAKERYHGRRDVRRARQGPHLLERLAGELGALPRGGGQLAVVHALLARRHNGDDASDRRHVGGHRAVKNDVGDVEERPDL
eukprot:1183842-Prorocentrum_minimum.AAC.6